MTGHLWCCRVKCTHRGCGWTSDILCVSAHNVVSPQEVVSDAEDTYRVLSRLAIKKWEEHVRDVDHPLIEDEYDVDYWNSND